MGFLSWAAIFLVAFLIFKLAGAFSLKGRTISHALEALRKNVHVVPDDSKEYFPTTSIMKATLRTSYDLAGIDKAETKESTEQASMLLDFVGRMFEEDSHPHMAQWCFSSRDSLQSN